MENRLMTVILTAAILCFCNASTGNKPHIVFFMADDLGWNDVGFHGLTEIPTPNLDALAYNGIILNNYYTHPMCSPSRAAFMSGKLATSTGLQHLVILDPQAVGLPLHLKTLPQFLNDLDYQSHVVGKWHLGFHKADYTPLKRGFKTHYGFWTGNSDHFTHEASQGAPRSMFCDVLCNDTREQIINSGKDFRDGFKNVNRSGEYLTYLYTKRATEIIENHDSDKPLFLFLSHHVVHRGNVFAPVRAPQELTDLFTNIQNDPTRKNFAGALTALDRSLGDVMEALELKGILRNTLIVFSSDNGSPAAGDVYQTGGSNYPLYGTKKSSWEGGVRVPAFLWAGFMKNKRHVYNGLMHIVDWLPTLFSAAGGERNVLNHCDLDGFDMWDAILRNRPSPRRNVLLQSDSLTSAMAYRSGDYKIVSGETVDQVSSCTGREPPPDGVLQEGSKTESVLKRVFGGDVKVRGTPIVVRCGQSPSERRCDATKEVCLFNIRKDPCELRNIAKDNPGILRRLQTELKQKSVLSPNFPLLQYEASPRFYDGYWVNWEDPQYALNDTTAC